MNTFRNPLITVIAVLLAVLVAAGSASAQEAGPPVSASAVYTVASGSEVDGGWSRLSRFDEGVTMTLHTADLTPGDVYTVWWVVFNAPENCNNGSCHMDDIFIFDDDGIVLSDAGARQLNMEQIEAAAISVQHATGAIVDEDGSAHFSSSIGAGAAPGIVFGPGLLDPQTAEVHLVVRTHGPLVEDVFDDQISTFLGGCAPFEAGEAPCADVQYAIHLPAAS